MVPWSPDPRKWWTPPRSSQIVVISALVCVSLDIVGVVSSVYDQSTKLRMSAQTFFYFDVSLNPPEPCELMHS